MKRRKLMLFITVVILLTVSLDAKEKIQSVTDDSGRVRNISADVKKVFSTSPMGTIMMYCLNQDKIAGLSWKVTELEKRYTSAGYQKLPFLGGNFGGKKNTMNYEEILKVRPDFILALGDIDEMAVSSADALEDKLGIAVLIYDGGIEKTSEVFRKIGKVTGDDKRAYELASYFDKLMKDTKETVSKIHAGKRVKLYYAEGPAGLETDPTGSRHSELVELCGGVNVAQGKILRGYGRTGVSLEQVLSWNPEMIIVCTDQGFSSGGFFNRIYTDRSWAEISAVKNRQVYEIPFAPFNWFDRPPSVNRIIGIKWLSNLLYPEYFRYDMRKETKEFYKLFYGRTLNDSEIDDILRNSLRKK